MIRPPLMNVVLPLAIVSPPSARVVPVPLIVPPVHVVAPLTVTVSVPCRAPALRDKLVGFMMAFTFATPPDMATDPTLATGELIVDVPLLTLRFPIFVSVPDNVTVEPLRFVVPVMLWVPA
jgi:hypothetical protein